MSEIEIKNLYLQLKIATCDSQKEINMFLSVMNACILQKDI